MAELTPMKRQYYEIKPKYPNCLLFFRLGDFYEMFDEDAKIASKELDLTLTTRHRARTRRTRPPCAASPTIPRRLYSPAYTKGLQGGHLRADGGPCPGQGLVSREVIRVITPGTVTDSSMLEESRSNYLCSIYLDYTSGAVAFCDISTGNSPHLLQEDAPPT